MTAPIILTNPKIRSILKETLIPVHEHLKEGYELIEKHMTASRDSINVFLSSGNTASDVAKKIYSEDDMDKNVALDLIHKAIYPTQSLMDIIQLEHYDSSLLIYGDSKTLYETAELEVMNHEVWDKMIISQAERKREVDFSLGECKKLFSFIELRYKRIKSYMEWVSKQLDALNRLDSMIRLKQKITEQDFYNTLARSGDFRL